VRVIAELAGFSEEGRRVDRAVVRSHRVGLRTRKDLPTRATLARVVQRAARGDEKGALRHEATALISGV
jgi:hypothetical protein